jgi:hypothetical protein
MKSITIAIDPETSVELEKIPSKDRDTYASQALRIGVLALRAARGDVDANVVKAEVDRLLASLKSAFFEYLKSADQVMQDSIRKNKDITTGGEAAFAAKLDATVNRAHETLAESMTRSSAPLIKLLDTGSSENVASRILASNKTLLDEFRERVQKEVVGQFSLDDPKTALSRLHKIVADSQQAIVREFSLDNSDGALSRLHESLGQRIETLGRMQSDFQTEVKQAIAALTAKKEADQATTGHGLVYEEAVGEALGAIVRHYGHTMDATGSTTGNISKSKVGDFVIRLGDDYSAPGALIVVEAKAAGGYGITKVLEESKTARENRGAQLAIFVIDPQYANKEWPLLNRHGDTILVQWAPGQDPVGLLAAFSIAAALTTKSANEKKSSKVDWSVLEKATLEVQKRAQSLEDISVWTSTIASSAAKILDRVRIAREGLESQVETLLDQISRLK